jgi:hypothetical protein
MNQLEKQHLAAIRLLRALEADYIELVHEHGRIFRYTAWSVPRADLNGSQKSQRGIVQVSSK